ncbi:farnesyl-diphosphate farnesyltransferase [Suhomyces tanzawaensis NRRL Y-17324]|uniref:Squalene synthase ERG9 n=1 Tax=Suhomyces tanzawaensis NRRL Y-17324 TaxID=984487 RepID=A0A1E4SNN3_9ASCO|nr:farnesyl-diphosphate farnesyltransferase [Suhomyces tanzawaensis NRRL Y-17324]ODV81134.1 farnesyl-diphosphate farnesyltransferase [Suhomyces tanzawaensis NRRL Y-17324]
MSSKVIQLLTHPGEISDVIRLLYFRKSLHPRNAAKEAPSLRRCYQLLKLTSRSFCAVIMELNPELRNVIMLFYLVLRALDTIEDDMTIDPAVKVPLLRDFDSKLESKDWTFNGNGPNEKDRAVLVEFDVILTEYHKLKPHYKAIIKDITNKMGNGMADYILDENFNLSGVQTVKDFDLYCHYVAGLVGEGLTKFLVDADFADKTVTEDDFRRSESMGLFLQKTNIIRDYHEDLEDGRSFWPKEIWSKYTDSLPSFHKDTSAESEFQGLSCINELVLNSLGHVKDVLEYLSLVNDPSSFNFCAIPQVMAIATLALVYNNPKVLHGNVKLRKGTTCSLILESRTFPGVVNIFLRYIKEINHKSSVKDPNYLKIGIKCSEIVQVCQTMFPTPLPNGEPRPKKAINRVIDARSHIDAAMQKRIDAEISSFRFTVYGTVALILSVLVYYVWVI